MIVKRGGISRFDRIFIGIIIAEMIITFISSFYIVSWSNSCIPDIFHPFGGGEICAQVITPTLHPIFYLSFDLLIATIAVFLVLKVLRIDKKIKHRKKKK
jgi:hypothetical protein